MSDLTHITVTRVEVGKSPRCMTFTEAQAAVDWLLNEGRITRKQLVTRLRSCSDIQEVINSGNNLLVVGNRFQSALFLLVEFNPDGMYIGSRSYTPIHENTHAYKLPNDLEYTVRHILAEFAVFDLRYVIERHITGIAIRLSPTEFSIRQRSRIWYMKVSAEQVIIDDLQGHSYSFTDVSLLLNLQKANSRMNVESKHEG